MLALTYSGTRTEIGVEMAWKLGEKWEMSRQYLVAGKVVEAVIVTKKSFKSYCSTIKIGKVDYLLAAETLKYVGVIKELLEGIKVKTESERDRNQLGVNYGIFLVMIYELLFGKGKINGGGVVKRKVMEYYEKLKVVLQEHMVSKNVTKATDLLPQATQQANNLFLYLRVNEIKMKIHEGLKEVKRVVADAKLDEHIPSLVVLPRGCTASFGHHQLVKDGQLIIQDKASCMPSQILYDAWESLDVGGDFIDCCAAPGNKTSHLASLLDSFMKGNKCQGRNSNVFAFDKSKERSVLLQDRMRNAGAANIVHVTNQDFLTVKHDDEKYRNVTAILLDPSCSGSGVVRALERVVEREKSRNFFQRRNEEEAEDNRVDKLRKFQISALRHAMGFPAVRCIAYSTCSINEAENEGVISEVLASQYDTNHRSHGEWDVAAAPRLANWQRRGLASCTSLEASQLQNLIRCDPEDGLNGFFVALLVKKDSKDSAVEEIEPVVESSSKKRVAASAVVSTNPSRFNFWQPYNKYPKIC